MPRAMALSSLTECLEFTLHRAGHLDLSFWRRRSTAAATVRAVLGTVKSNLAAYEWGFNTFCSTSLSRAAPGLR